MDGGDAIKLVEGVPDRQRAQAVRLYWHHFGRQILPLRVPDRLGCALLERALQGDRVVTAQGPCGELVGVMGLRDAGGGILSLDRMVLRDIFGHVVGGLLWAIMQSHRSGPDTTDMLIDGIAVADGWRRRGVGTLLMAAACELATLRGYPGLQAEVAANNRAALAFYRSLGFQERGRAKIGWPWSFGTGGAAQIMRLAASPPDLDRCRAAS